MADETQAVPQDTPAADAESASTGSMGMGLVLGALVGGLALGAAAGVFLVGPKMARASGYVIAHHAGADASKKKGEDSTAAKNTIVSLDNLVVNPAGSGGQRFLMCSVAIELGDDKLKDQLTARDAEVRDAVLRVLGSKTVEQLVDMSARDAIKGEVKAALTSLFKVKDGIRRLYFPQFVVQ